MHPLPLLKVGLLRSYESFYKHPHITKTLAIDDIDALSETLAVELSLDTPSIEGWIFPDTYFFNMEQATSNLSAELSGCKRRLLMRFGNPGK